MRRIVFDWDGTLLDSSSRHVTLLRRICGCCEHSLDNYLSCKANGMNTFTYLTKIQKISETTAKYYTGQWIREIETPELMKEDTLFADALTTLYECKLKYRLLLISSRQREELLSQQIRAFGLSHYFEYVICVKPGDSKSLVAQKYDNIICWVGDTEADRNAAKELKIPFYALNRGFRSEDYWKCEGIKSYPDLSRLQEFILYLNP